MRNEPLCNYVDIMWLNTQECKIILSPPQSFTLVLLMKLMRKKEGRQRRAARLGCVPGRHDWDCARGTPGRPGHCGSPPSQRDAPQTLCLHCAALQMPPGFSSGYRGYLIPQLCPVTASVFFFLYKSLGFLFVLFCFPGEEAGMLPLSRNNVFQLQLFLQKLCLVLFCLYLPCEFCEEGTKNTK